MPKAIEAHSAMPPTKRLLSFEDLARYGVPFSKGWVRDLVKNGKFPRPVYLTQGRMAWPEADILAWIDAKEQEAAARARPLRSVDEYKKS